MEGDQPQQRIHKNRREIVRTRFKCNQSKKRLKKKVRVAGKREESVRLGVIELV